MTFPIAHHLPQLSFCNKTLSHDCPFLTVLEDGSPRSACSCLVRAAQPHSGDPITAQYQHTGELGFECTNFVWNIQTLATTTLVDILWEQKPSIALWYMFSSINFWYINVFSFKTQQTLWGQDTWFCFFCIHDLKSTQHLYIRHSSGTFPTF